MNTDYINATVVIALLILMCYLVVKDILDTRDVPHPKLSQDHKCKDRVRTIIICGNCGAPYHVPELTREIEIECSCGEKYAPWKEIEP